MEAEKGECCQHSTSKHHILSPLTIQYDSHGISYDAPYQQGERESPGYGLFVHTKFRPNGIDQHGESRVKAFS